MPRHVADIVVLILWYWYRSIYSPFPSTPFVCTRCPVYLAWELSLCWHTSCHSCLSHTVPPRLLYTVYVPWQSGILGSTICIPWTRYPIWTKSRCVGGFWGLEKSVSTHRRRNIVYVNLSSMPTGDAGIQQLLFKWTWCTRQTSLHTLWRDLAHEISSPEASALVMCVRTIQVFGKLFLYN